MKADRLLGITLALLRHGTLSASQLARRFEVSRRTIQRDMDALGQAGLPLMAIPGAGGGYRLAEGFVLDRRLLDAKDWAQLSAALEGYRTATGQPGGNIADKLGEVPAAGQHIYLDLSVALESKEMEMLFAYIEEALDDHAVLRLAYVDAHQHVSRRDVEPIALTFTWYAWYLFAFCRERQDWRLFKLARMQGCTRTGEYFTPREDVAPLMRTQMQRDARPMLKILLRCQAAVRHAVEEYLHGTVMEEGRKGEFLYLVEVPQGERMWLSLLLSFGGKIEVLTPPSVREQVRSLAEEILTLYE